MHMSTYGSKLFVSGLSVPNAAVSWVLYPSWICLLRQKLNCHNLLIDTNRVLTLLPAI